MSEYTKGIRELKSLTSMVKNLTSIEAMLEELGGYDSARRAAEARIESLKTEEDEATAALAKVKQELADGTRKLKFRLQDLNTQIAHAETKLVDITAAADAAKAERDDEAAMLTERIRDLNAQVSQRDRAIDELDKQIAAKQARLTEITSEVERIRKVVGA